jgi:hypothetical protein
MHLDHKVNYLITIIVIFHNFNPILVHKIMLQTANNVNI